MKIIFTGGGTAGHIFPIVAIIREIKRTCQEPDKLRFFYLGPRTDFGLDLLFKEGVEIKTIISGKFRRYFSIRNFFDLFKIPVGFFQALFWLFILNPAFVFSKGGFGSLAVSLAAPLLRIPLFLHESDIVPGLTSKITSRWAVEVFVSFEKTEYFKTEKRVVVGNPTRKEIAEGSAEAAKLFFNIEGEKPLILVLGGSQGAAKINDAIIDLLPDILYDFELIHQTGVKNFKEIKEVSQTLLSEKLAKRYHLSGFLKEEELADVLHLADLVVSRAGSSALFEIALNGKPVILLPLAQSAQDHQVKNAYFFAQEAAAEVIEQNNLKPHFFLGKIKHLFENEDVLKDMAANISILAKPKAAWVIANYLLEYLNQIK